MKYLPTCIPNTQCHRTNTWTGIDMEHASFHVNSCLCRESFVIGWVARVLEVQELRNANRHHNRSTDRFSNTKMERTSCLNKWIKPVPSFCKKNMGHRRTCGRTLFGKNNMSSIPHTLHTVSTWGLGCMKNIFVDNVTFRNGRGKRPHKGPKMATAMWENQWWRTTMVVQEEH